MPPPTLEGPAGEIVRLLDGIADRVTRYAAISREATSAEWAYLAGYHAELRRMLEATRPPASSTAPGTIDENMPIDDPDERESAMRELAQKMKWYVSDDAIEHARKKKPPGTVTRGWMRWSITDCTLRRDLLKHLGLWPNEAEFPWELTKPVNTAASAIVSQATVNGVWKQPMANRLYNIKIAELKALTDKQPEEDEEEDGLPDEGADEPDPLALGAAEAIYDPKGATDPAFVQRYSKLIQPPLLEYLRLNRAVEVEREEGCRDRAKAVVQDLLRQAVGTMATVLGYPDVRRIPAETQKKLAQMAGDIVASGHIHEETIKEKTKQAIARGEVTPDSAVSPGSTGTESDEV